MHTTIKIVLALTALFLAFGTGVQADTFTSTLDTGNLALSGFTGPFGTVSVDLTSSMMAHHDVHVANKLRQYLLVW